MPEAWKFGAREYGMAGGHKVAHFPTPEAGAAGAMEIIVLNKYDI